MMRVRNVAKHAAIAASALVGVATILIIGASPASAGGIDGTGTTGACVTTGQIKFKPALTTTGMGAGGVKIKSKGSTCTGGTLDGVHVTASKGKGIGTTASTNCTGLVGTQMNMFSIVIKWKTDGTVKLNPSTVTITSTTGGLTMDGHGSFDATGSVTMGSFNGAPVTAHVETDQLATDIATACGGKGVKKITFGLNGNSSINVGM
jgi:hypothetical protein